MASGSEQQSQADGRTSRWAGQQERRRAQFVDAALTAIERYGPDTSTEQIASVAGVARTRLYKHFTDAADLNRSIAQRASEMIMIELAPAFTEPGPPSARIGAGVRTHLRWLAEHAALYRYLSRHAVTLGAGRGDAISDIKSTIGNHLAELLGGYLSMFGGDPRVAQPLGHGIVGLAESATSRWLDDPTQLTFDELSAHLASWIWQLIDSTLREAGITLDPNEPLAMPTENDQP